MNNLITVGLTKREWGDLMWAHMGYFNHLPASPEPERFVMPWQEVPKTRALRAGLETS